MSGEFQPSGGLAFQTTGHYGSAFFDPMDGSRLEIAVCDQCVSQLASDTDYVFSLESPEEEAIIQAEEFLDDRLEDWHESEDGAKLALFLGMSDPEFSDFATNGVIPQRIVDEISARFEKQDLFFKRVSDLFSAMPDEKTLNDIANEAEIRLRKSLKEDFGPLMDLLKASASSIHERTLAAVSGNDALKTRQACLQVNFVTGLMTEFIDRMQSKDRGSRKPSHKKGGTHATGTQN